VRASDGGGEDGFAAVKTKRSVQGAAKGSRRSGAACWKVSEKSVND
jgi:hypothetical protein